MADARSILSVILLCAALGTVIEVEAQGEDEDLAIQAVESAFVTPDNTSDVDTDLDQHRR